MDYIIFDLEWNQCPDERDTKDPHLPFEIVEIGAVKLNKDRKVTSEFHRMIKPEVYHWINSRTREIIRLDYQSLRQKGVPFPQAARDFFTWCGDDARFCTWGDQDLLELQRNLKYYDLESLLPGPLKYYNVQKLFSIYYEDGRSRRSLEYAVDLLGLAKTEGFHRALADAHYTAALFARIGEECIHKNFSIDAYQNPKNKRDEIHIFYEDRVKFISREFASKEDAIADREVCSTACPRCHRPTRRKIRWFSVNARRYFSVSMCPEHGYVKGKVRMKKTDDGMFFVEKTTSLIDEEDAERILEKKELLCAKRRLHRRSMSERY